MCSASGVPKPNMTWSFSGGPLPPHEQDGGSIKILFVNNTSVYEGSYTCQASSRAGNISRTVELIVDGECCVELMVSVILHIM